MSEENKQEPAGSYAPKFVTDLNSVTAERFSETLEDFDKWRISLGEPGPLEINNGWYTANQQLAEQWLLRNPKGANRKVSLGTVIYYATQQATGKWPRTGQSVIFTADGTLLDGQHRLWACYFGNTTFDTHVVADVPVFENLFAYVDNSKARTASTALQTAGFNGLSPLIYQTVQIVQSFDAHAYSATHKKRMPRLAPIEVVEYVRAHTDIRQAARLAVGEYKAACELLGHKDVVAFMVYKVATLFDETVIDEFLEDVGDTTGTFTKDGSPVAALQKVILADQASTDPMGKHQVLAHVIKAFNAWKRGESVKKISLKVTEAYPAFVTQEDLQQAVA